MSDSKNRQPNDIGLENSPMNKSMGSDSRNAPGPGTPPRDDRDMRRDDDRRGSP